MDDDSNKFLTLGTCAGLLLGFFAMMFSIGTGQFVSAGFFAIGVLVLVACLAKLAGEDEGYGND